MYEFFPGSGAQDYLQGNIINAPVQPLWKSKDDQRPAVHGTRSQRYKTRESEARSGRLYYRDVSRTLPLQEALWGAETRGLGGGKGGRGEQDMIGWCAGAALVHAKTVSGSSG